jgi:hypothetical protein
MSNLHHESTFEIDQDLSFTRQEWVAQRVGWGVMGFIVILALLGVFSSGPLSHTTVTSMDGHVSLQYARFVRYLAPTILQVHLHSAANRDQQTRLWLDRRYLQEVEVQQITPQPQRVEAAAERFSYIFNHAMSEQPIIVTFHVQPHTMGSLSGRIGLDNGPLLLFSQLVYP